MSISVVIASYGDHEWKSMAEERALRSLSGFGDEDSFVLRHENSGTVASSRNAAAELASGDWLCFLDADDELAPGYVAAMEKAVERNDERTLLTPAVQIVRRGRAGAPTFFRECDLRDANWMVVGTLIHHDLFWEVGGFDNHPHGLEDWALWSKCVRAGASIVKVPDAVYRYYANPDSMHRQLWRDKKVQREAHRRVAAELDAWEAARSVITDTRRSGNEG